MKAAGLSPGPPARNQPTGTNTTVTSDSAPIDTSNPLSNSSPSGIASALLGDLSSVFGGGGASASSTSAATSASDVVQNAAAQPLPNGQPGTPIVKPVAPIVPAPAPASGGIMGFFKSALGLGLLAVLVTVAAVFGYRHYHGGHKRLHAHH